MYSADRYDGILVTQFVKWRDYGLVDRGLFLDKGGATTSRSALASIQPSVQFASCL